MTNVANFKPHLPTKVKKDSSIPGPAKAHYDAPGAWNNAEALWGHLGVSGREICPLQLKGYS